MSIDTPHTSINTPDEDGMETAPEGVSLPTEVLAFFKVLLTPVFGIIAGYVATLVARYFPGSDIKRSQLVWVFLIVAAAAAVAVIRWLERQPAFKELKTDLQPVLGEIKQIEPYAPEITALIDRYGPELLAQVTNLLKAKALASVGAVEASKLSESNG